MDLTERILATLQRSETGLVIALLVTFVLYFVFRKSAELGKHAAQNTSATLVVCGLNAAAAWIFVDDLNRFLQSTYDALGIPTLPRDFWSGLPLAAVAVIGIVARDFADYWNHRLMHTKWGWPTHAAHHSDTHVNAFTVYRVHILESVVMTMSYIVLLTWLQMPQAIPFAVLFGIVHNMYVHVDLDIEHGPFRYLIASPRFHRWHHADVPEAYGKNLANLMPLWDKLFGTYRCPGPCTAPMGALTTGVEDKNPISIYTYPFREWARLIRESRARSKEDKAGSDAPRVQPAE